MARTCKIDGCTRTAFQLGLCQVHHAEARAGKISGVITTPITRPTPRPNKHSRELNTNAPATRKRSRIAALCRIPGCTQKRERRGICGTHFHQIRRGTIDENGNQVFDCCECGNTFPRKWGRKQCDECRTNNKRARDIVYRETKLDKKRSAEHSRKYRRRHRRVVAAISRRSGVRRRSDAARYLRQRNSSKQRYAELQQLSLEFVRSKPYFWTKQEESLLSRMWPAVKRDGEWERLFRILGRPYSAMQKKISQLRKVPTR